MKKAVILALTSVMVCLSFFTLFTSVYAEQPVGVKVGDWVEYEVSVSGTGSMPPHRDVRWTRMEVISVEGDALSVNVIVRYANESWGSSIWKFNFTEGNVGGWLIIPANLGVGDTFFDASSEPSAVLIQGEEQREVLGAIRTVTYGSDVLREIKEWDKDTGFFICAVEAAKNFTDGEGWYYEDLTVIIQATATNLWNRQILGVDQPVFALLVSGLVFVIVGLVSGLLIWQRENLSKLSSRCSVTIKRVVIVVIVVGVVVFADLILAPFLMNLGLIQSEVNMVMQSVWMSLLLASIGFRYVGNYFTHGFLMITVVIATLIGFASVLLMWSPADSTHLSLVYFNSHIKIVKFVTHGVLSIPALVFGGWFVAIWRPNSTTFPKKSKRVVKWLLIMWVLSYLAGVIGYIIEYLIL